MTAFGYTLLCEQRGPRELVSDAVAAERAGFDFEVMSDHAFPCGPDVAAHVDAVRPFVDAGYTHVALAQVGGETQPEFLEFAERELLPALALRSVWPTIATTGTWSSVAS
ncbi:hypothetical protein [Pseudonocardia sp. GCM10023141]|uniref:hypothetical protein n=1 Tax=Pseudonocardia sp. GCM10023141 TaxID=3252653 RepID=UPI0036226BB1